MQGSEPRTRPHPPVYAVLNQSNSSTFNLDEYKARTTQVFADFQEYRKVLTDLKRRVEVLEDRLKEERET